MIYNSQAEIRLDKLRASYGCQPNIALMNELAIIFCEILKENNYGVYKC